MLTIRTTFHNAKTRFGHAVHRMPGLCLGCGVNFKPKKRPNATRTGWFLDWPARCPAPQTCACDVRLGCWMILRSYTQGSGRCYELDPALPERYRTRKDAVKAKKEKNL